MKNALHVVGLLTIIGALAAGESFSRNRSRSDRSPDRARAATQPANSASPADFTGRYGLLEEKNIFLRVRQAPRASRPVVQPSTQPAAPVSAPAARIEDSLLLTGIALQEGRNVAFIENTSSGLTERIVSGQPVANGAIAEIFSDYLEYESPGGRTRVAIGHTLSGDAAQPSTAPTTVPASAGGASDPNNPNLSLLERMKLRRLQELKK